jgi:hypothetical protein
MGVIRLENSDLDQNLAIRTRPPIIRHAPAIRAKPAECCLNPTSPKWSIRMDVMIAAVTVMPVNELAPIFPGTAMPAMM